MRQKSSEKWTPIIILFYLLALGFSILLVLYTEEFTRLIFTILISSLASAIITFFIVVFFGSAGIKKARDGSWRFHGQYTSKNYQSTLIVVFFVIDLFLIFLLELTQNSINITNYFIEERNLDFQSIRLISFLIFIILLAIGVGYFYNKNPNRRRRNYW